MKTGIRYMLVAIVLAWVHVDMATCSNAQTTGVLRLFIDPGHDYQFVLDGKYRMQQRELTLGEGPHRFTFWAPKHRMVDTVLTVAPNTVTTFTMRLPVSAEYLAWQREVAKYKREVVLGRGLPLLATVGTGAWTVLNLRKYKAAHDQLKDDEALYASARSPREIDELKDVTLPADKDELARWKSRTIISSACFAVSAATTLWMFHRTKGKAIPQFEDKEKVRFDGLVYVPRLYPGSEDIWFATLSFPLR